VEEDVTGFLDVRFAEARFEDVFGDPFATFFSMGRFAMAAS